MHTIEQLINQHFIAMCEQGDLEQVKFWLTSPTLTYHADINADNGGPIINACLKGHLSIIKYLLTSPDLEEHADIHLDNDQAFRFAYAKYSLDYSETIAVIRYLVMDYGITLTARIKKELKRFPNKEVTKMFLKRNFHIFSTESEPKEYVPPKLFMIKG